jgi:hypothetical protein
LKQTLISAYFTRQKFVSIEKLPETERFNSAFFTETMPPSLVQSVSLLRPKMQAQASWLHIDNASSDDFALSLHEIEELAFSRLP